MQSLVELGFTQLEAEIYAHLLRESPATGYRVAQALGKPAANVYKALESLQTKGGVMVDDAETRLCRPTPYRELLGQLERRFRDRCRQASVDLAEIQIADRDDRVYQLHSVDHVLERARQMLARCERVALLDVFPEPLRAIEDDIARAIARGIDVVVKVYAPVRIEGAHVILPRNAGEVIGAWPGQQLNVVIDAEEHLLALLETGGTGVLQAIWTASTYLSCLVHSWLGCELAYTDLANEVAAGQPRERLVAILRRTRIILSNSNPGYRTLVKRFRGPSQDGSGRRGEDEP